MTHHGRMNSDSQHTTRNLPREAPTRTPLTYAEKHAQANREAAATVIGLAATIVVWIACGFGLSGLDVTVFHTPLWVIGGTIGTWVFAIALTVFLAKRVFTNFDLDDEPETERGRDIAIRSEAKGQTPHPVSHEDGDSHE